MDGIVELTTETVYFIFKFNLQIVYAAFQIEALL